MADRRVALVIGNAAYQHATELANPKNDAVDIALLLKSLDFEVVEGHDLDKASMDRTIRAFAEKLSGSQLALFFYAGHGLQVGGQNYLVPTDAQLNSGVALDFETVRLDIIQRTMEREATTNILIVDACRDNPLARNLARALGTRSTAMGRGLAKMEAGEGTLISFSTQPGNVALDGKGRNSPFAAAFIKHAPIPGDDLPTILINVRKEVVSVTGKRQVPWENSSLTSRVYFIAPSPAPAAPIASGGYTYEQQIELSFWDAVKDTGNPAILQTYIDQYPKGAFVALARALIEQFERRSKSEQAEKERVAAAAQRSREAEQAEKERVAAAAQRSREAEQGEKERAAAAQRSREAEQARAAAQALEASSSASKKAELARRLYRELKRVGCYRGEAGKEWTTEGQVALQRFASLAKVTIVTDEPTQAAIDGVAAHKVLVCPVPSETRTAPVRQEPSGRHLPVSKAPQPNKSNCREESYAACWARHPTAHSQCRDGIRRKICR